MTNIGLALTVKVQLHEESLKKSFTIVSPVRRENGERMDSGTGRKKWEMVSPWG